MQTGRLGEACAQSRAFHTSGASPLYFSYAHRRRHGDLATLSNSSGAATRLRLRSHHPFRHDACHRHHRRWPNRLRRGQGRRGQRSGMCLAGHVRSRRAAPTAHRPGPARDQPAVGAHVQRRARSLRADARAGLPHPRPAWADHRRHERRGYGAVGLKWEAAELPGCSVARRRMPRRDACLCQRRLGGRGRDWPATAGLREQGLPSRENACGCDGWRRRCERRAGAGSAPGTWPEDQAHGRRARHL